MRLEAKEWLDQAESELKSAQDLLRSNRYSQAAFHAHQVAEFSLKALSLEKKSMILGHDLVYIARKLNAPEEILDKCDLLNPAYTDARYVDRAGIAPFKLYDKERALANLHSSKEVIEWVKRQIKK